MKRKPEMHGMSRSYLYFLWQGMINRCYNSKEKAYPDYGGRGITVCDRWRYSFVNFFNDMGHRPSKEYSIDRINNNGNYEPGNCRWATLDVQLANRRKNKAGVQFEYNGETLNLKDASRRFGIPYTTIRGRVEWGWDVLLAATTPSGKVGRRHNKVRKTS